MTKTASMMSSATTQTTGLRVRRSSALLLAPALFALVPSGCATASGTGAATSQEGQGAAEAPDAHDHATHGG